MINALDAMLEGNEPIVHDMISKVGPMGATEWMNAFNNACMQIRCFEETLSAQQLTGATFNAPLYNLSHHDCH